MWDGRKNWLNPVGVWVRQPQARSGGETVQKSAIGGDGWRMSPVAGCVARSSTSHLDEREAREIADHQIDVISSDGNDVCDLAQLSQVARQGY